MVYPRTMCRKHLLGEHVELHMVAAHLRRGRKIDGFVAHNCVEPRSVGRRHAALAKEMARRGWQHASPLAQPPVARWQRPGARVDRAAALRELLRRCPACRARAKSCEIKGLRRYKKTPESPCGGTAPGRMIIAP